MGLPRFCFLISAVPPRREFEPDNLQRTAAKGQEKRFSAKKDKSIRLYRDAHTTQERYQVWKDTYHKQIHDDLIFSEDSAAYKIGVKPLLKKNLQDFTPDDKIVNTFEEILRHNNVSDKEKVLIDVKGLYAVKELRETNMTWWRL